MRRGVALSSAALIFLALAAWLYWQNHSLVLTRYELNAGLETPLVIAQISDLHGMSFGADQSALVSLLEREKPDVIVMTGDLIDESKGGLEPAVTLAQAMTRLAPVCFVSGNHEFLSERYEELTRALRDAGVFVLEGDSVMLRPDVSLTGAQDVRFVVDSAAAYGGYVASLAPQPDVFSILLAHRPEFAPDYAAAGFDLALCGHAHGGQIRLPVLGGLYAPGQGVLPRYDSGLYDVDGMTLAVSRGLGNSVFPFRVNNRPELVLLTVR